MSSPTQAPAPLAALLSLALVAGGCDGDGGPEDGGGDADGDVDGDAADADAVDGDVDPCPAEMALVDDGAGTPFCIDRFEHPGVGSVPTTGLSWRRARDACVEERKELCLGEQWERACVGTSPAACIGPMGPTGARTDCVSGFGVFDMAGNAAEWTATPGGSVTWFVFGGSSSTAEIGCDVSEEVRAESARSDVGFRCCRRPRS